MTTLTRRNPQPPTTVAPDAAARFAVPYVHRLQFTDDVFGADRAALAALLEPSGDLAPKVQFWLDGHVVGTRPGLLGEIDAFLGEYRHAARPAGVHVAPGGEAVKNDWAHVERVLQAINDSDLDRRSYVVVVGGGAVLDAVGFAAATAHRGIRLIRLPSTTLAQGDSGVGVKNAVNRYGKKNWLGTFAVPWAVVNDTALLASLPDRDFSAGFSEAVKVALLKSGAEFDRLCRNATRIRGRDLAAALPAIRASAELHRAHITRGGDPFEALEARPLDYGHWSAHKLEALTAHELRHGEAVAIGLALDARYSVQVGMLPAGGEDRVHALLKRFGFHLWHAALESRDADGHWLLLRGLEEFREHLGGELTITLLRDIGVGEEVHQMDPAEILRALVWLRRREQGG